MAVPVWLGATATDQALPGQINQFLGTHQSTWIYSGTTQASQTTGSGLYTSTASTYLAQSFTTGVSQTAIGQVWLQVSTVGGSPTSASITPLTLSLYANSGGAPAGSALGSVSLNEQYVYSAPFWTPFPLAVSVTASTVYWLVTSPAGTGSAYYVWQRSNQSSGASTSPDNATWSAQAYGLMYQVLDQSGSGNVKFLYDDAGARWTAFTYDTLGRPSTITEYATAQGAPLTSTRTLTYTSGVLTGVS